MLLAYIAEELIGGSDTAGFHVVVSLLDTSNRFFKILLFLFEVGGQGFIKGIGGSLAASASEFFQFGLALGF